ncbi:MAG: hypothetical protein JWN01_693 [Patescibacteria group bacterium]|nr:hypothetical protein [Patescibacteria group bacterium]
MKSALASLASFRVPLAVFFLGIVLAFVVGGPAQALVVAILAILEISLSFDNAVLNATILRRMNPFWQRMFLTIGLLIAVFGMRLIFPIAIVMVTAGLDFATVVDLVLHHSAEYAHHLELAHPAIASFGGIFLFMIFLDFLIDESKRVHWLEPFERPLARAGQLKTLSTLIALAALLGVTFTLPHEEGTRVLMAGVVGQVTYLAVRGLSRLFAGMGGVSEQEERHGSAGAATMRLAGKAAFSLFLYLEVLDASFSFDGVVGAFAITSNVLSIALGLGIGALFVRELTVWLVRHKALEAFVYLEHGAHYGVGSLAVLLAVSLEHQVPELVTGLVGAMFIILSLISSVLVSRATKNA